MAEEKSKILVIGATGYIGKFIVAGSVRLGHATFALVRDPAPSDPAKAAILDGFRSSGVTLIQGDLYDHESLVKAIKRVDVVISTVGIPQLPDQIKIVAAIKEAGNVKRFLPSEFGSDSKRVHAVDPAKSLFTAKAQIQQAIEAEEIPYTYVISNCFSRYFLPSLGQEGATNSITKKKEGATNPPRDRAIIFGDGIPKAIFVDEEDIATYTIKAVDDSRTLNKNLYLDPPANICSYNELISLWEKKIGKTLERVYIHEEELLKKIQVSPIPVQLSLSFCHSIFVKGDQTNFEINPSFGVRSSELYPEVKYTTVDEYLNIFV